MTKFKAVLQTEITFEVEADVQDNAVTKIHDAITTLINPTIVGDNVAVTVSSDLDDRELLQEWVEETKE